MQYPGYKKELLGAELKRQTKRVTQAGSPSPFPSQASGDFKRQNDQGSLQKNEELNHSLEFEI